MNTQQIEARIRYWTKRRCPKQAAAWRSLLQARQQQAAAPRVWIVDTNFAFQRARIVHVNGGLK
jgi:hypothetical protein